MRVQQVLDGFLNPGTARLVFEPDPDGDRELDRNAAVREGRCDARGLRITFEVAFNALLQGPLDGNHAATPFGG